MKKVLYFTVASILVLSMLFLGCEQPSTPVEQVTDSNVTTEQTEISVTYNANGGTGSMNAQIFTGSATLNPNTFTKDGYGFVEWNTNADGTGTGYTDTATYNGDSTTLYAQWLPLVTVQFDANGGTGSMDAQTFVSSTTLHANAFTKDAYSFNGWNTSADGTGTSYTDTATYSGESTTLYAQWVDSYTVTYTISDGKVTVTGLADPATINLIIPSYIEGYPVTDIAASAFKGTLYSVRGSLTSVVIPDTVTSIGNYAFEYNNLTSVVIGDSVTSIGSSAFSDNSLTSVVIPDSVTSIGSSAFSNNSLTSVVIPDSVTTIGDGAFYRNFFLTGVVIGSGVTTIGRSAFASNGLISLTIPDNVTSIGDSAFDSNDLTSVVIGSGVITIGDSAFASNNLTNVVLGSGVTTIGDSAFSENFLETISVDSANTVYKAVDNVLYTKDGTTLLLCVKTVTSFTVPSGVTTIGESAFHSNKLTSVSIPNSVTTIANYAFYNNSLTSVVIPDSVTDIGNYAFSGNSLTSVVIPDSITSIRADVFSDNNLTSVTIPNSVTYISSSGFKNNKLTSITIPDSVTYIDNYAFQLNNLISITIPDSITYIGNFAFNGNNLISVNIPDNVTNMGDYAFSNNTTSCIIYVEGFDTDWIKPTNWSDSWNNVYYSGDSSYHPVETWVR